MKKLNIFNIRLGLACNSSSSHSILILKNSSVFKTDEYSDFDWDFFTASDQNSKNNYFYALLKQNIDNLIPDNEKNDFFTDFFGEHLNNIDTNSYIDHQSVITFPLSFDGKINMDFVNEFYNFIMSDNVVIAGGNDNTENQHPILSSDDLLSSFSHLPLEDTPSNWIIRHDDNLNFWTLFNKNSGSKLRFSFDSNQLTPTKSSTPELVDIKITDYCPFDCDFCYQNSTTEGQHASMEYIQYISNELKKAQVFEVAIGGGEPTLHPNFTNIIKSFKENNIVFNFTTKNFAIFKHKDIDYILDNIGAIAFSVQSTQEIKKLHSFLLDCPHEKAHLDSYQSYINIQYVMGSSSIEEFKNILSYAKELNINITLLGFKEYGRGNSFIPQDYSNWLEIVKEVKNDSYMRISIDTALASQYKSELLEFDKESQTFHTSEGSFSLYIDAVSKKMYPSSYSNNIQEYNFDDSWIDNYQYIGIEAPNKKPKKSFLINN